MDPVQKPVVKVHVFGLLLGLVVGAMLGVLICGFLFAVFYEGLLAGSIVLNLPQ